MEDTVDDVVGAGAGGDHDAEAGVVALFHREYTTLVRMATLLLGDPASAEDVVQDAFVEVHRRWRRLRDPGRAGGYLRRAVVNGARSHLRRRGSAQRAVDRLYEEGPGDTTAGESLAAARRTAVLGALAALPRRQREVLVLRHYLDLSEAEIARTLGIGRGSVKTHASRGAATLRRRLEEER